MHSFVKQIGVLVDVADGCINAVVLGLISLGALGAHCVAIRLWRTHPIWSVVVFTAAAAAVLISLSNSLGAIATRSDETIAVRARASEASEQARRELARVTRERESLPTSRAIDEAAIAAAQEAVRAAERIRAVECEKRGPRCRERESEEQAGRRDLEAALTDKALSDRALTLEREAEALRRRIASGTAIQSINPQAEALATLFRLAGPEGLRLVRWQQFALASVLEILTIVALVAFELLGRDGASVGAVKFACGPKQSEAPASASPARPRLVVLEPRPFGSVSEIVLTLLEPKVSGRVESEDLYRAYVVECRRQGKQPHTPLQFIEAMHQLCTRCGIRAQAADGAVYLLNVRLKCHDTERLAS